LFSTALSGRLFLFLCLLRRAGDSRWPGRGADHDGSPAPAKSYLLLLALTAAHHDQAQQDHGQEATNDAYDAAFHFLVPPTSKKGR